MGTYPKVPALPWFQLGLGATPPSGSGLTTMAERWPFPPRGLARQRWLSAFPGVAF